ncbi:MAG: OmpA family protein [Bacteroidales bacterium]|nr:OmpA family protein [Bacteroidales bacterium]
MKKIIIFSLAILLSFGLLAQSKGKKKKTKKPAPVAPIEVTLPDRCSDCFFPVTLQADVPFGPTEPLRGHGYVNEIHKDAQTKNVFDQEHNSIWYFLEIPYDGKLLIDITPKSFSDDYNFIVYKYTDKYFCNRVEKNRVKPIRSVQSVVNTEIQGKTGLSLKSSTAHISKESTEAYGKYIDVKAGESYVIVVDNLNDTGLGHTITCEVWTNYSPLVINPIDSLLQQRTTANLHVKELETGRTVIDKQNAGSTRIKLLPEKTYEISLNKEGFFNYTRRISHAQAIGKDTILSARLVQIKPGSPLPINGDLYFDNNEQGELFLMQECYPALKDVVQALTQYPQINVNIIGRIMTEGLNVKKDNEVSKARAEAIKKYLVSQGIAESRITTRGSSIKELEAQIKEQSRSRNRTLNPPCEIRIANKK